MSDQKLNCENTQIENGPMGIIDKVLLVTGANRGLGRAALSAVNEACLVEVCC